MSSESGSSGDESPENVPLPVSTSPFEKISCLGEGAFGAVWLARCRSSGKYVALKEISRHLADPLLLEPERDVLREIAESREKSALVSPALAGLVSTFVTPFAICMAMDLVEGTHLQDHLRAEGQMQEVRVQWYTAELAGALDWLHKAGWLYRDLKLTNVMLSLSENSYGRVKLIDFGFAIHQLSSDKAVGTLQTMAPEVISCANSKWAKELNLDLDVGYGPAADWWSLGAVLFELLSGEAPFGRYDDILLEGFQVLKAQGNGLPWSKAPTVSDAAKDAASSLCQLKPDDRAQLPALKDQVFFSSVDWRKLESDGPGPSFEPMGFTIASASEERVKPRRGAAMPPSLDGPDPFENF